MRPAGRGEDWVAVREGASHEPKADGGGLVDRVLELAAVGGLAALGPQDCLWAGSMSAIDTLLVRDGTTLPGVVCDESGWRPRGHLPGLREAHPAHS